MRQVPKSLLLLRGASVVHKARAPPSFQTLFLSRSLGTTSTKTTSKPTFRSSEDPHEMADRFVKDSSGRISGTEALESVPTSVKLRNVALATTLVGFVTGVWWYSMNAVGRADEVSFELEAEEARERALLQAAKDDEHANLANLEMGVVAGEDEMVVAVAAPDEVAFGEEDKNRALMKPSDKPLWKRVVFFWRA